MHDMGEPKNNYETLRKKPDRKDYIMYDAIYMKFLEKAKLVQKLISGGLGLELGAGLIANGPEEWGIDLNPGVGDGFLTVEIHWNTLTCTLAMGTFHGT